MLAEDSFRSTQNDMQHASVGHAIPSRFPSWTPETLHTILPFRDTPPHLDALTFSGIESRFSTLRFSCQYRHFHGSALRHDLKRFVASTYQHSDFIECLYSFLSYQSCTVRFLSLYSFRGWTFVRNILIIEKETINAKCFEGLLVRLIHICCTQHSILDLDARINTTHILHLIYDNLSTSSLMLYTL